MKIGLNICLILLLYQVSNASEVNNINAIDEAQIRWAKCQYEMANQPAQEACFIHEIDFLSARSNKNMSDEMSVMLAVNYASLAGVYGGSKGLSLAREAKDRLEPIVQNTPNVLKGAALVTLGALYYRVPSWPISFGDDKKAGRYLAKAYDLDSKNLTTNYFYADYLVETGDKHRAIAILESVIVQQTSPESSVMVRGRINDIKELLSKIK
ncbi:hypothetical protein [Vibrio viridaestus]|uniref:Tetratricopeptide repeat protein n=1 Tax=Vibrio viridaestus TaxID=2487322 RepID=A0A3N9TJY9_9VIBR|nr:hypothetical protein [Vibrio viridaestus]RQW64491.1 hypothetical protein EES38_00120 [Vibrio viridaestus]